MRQSRVKWLVGGLMVSAGGVLAVAGLPGRHGVACDGPVPLPIPMLPARFEPPVSVPTPKPQDLPMSTPLVSPAPLSIPVIEASQPETRPAQPSRQPEPITIQPVKIEPVKTEATKPEPATPEPATPILEIPSLPAAPVPTPTASPKPLEFPELQLPGSVPVIPASNAAPSAPAVPAPTPAPNPTPAPTPVPAPASNLPALPVPAQVAPTGPTTPVIEAAPASLPVAPVNPSPAAVPSASVPATVESKPVPVQATVVAETEPRSTSSVERKLKVIVHLGDERPRFEVRDGDEIYLKVICDRVNIKSPSDQGEKLSVLTASGKVTFITPGGEGTCEELSLMPGTGQLTVMNRVSFKYNWGKLETTVSGEKMNFRLGSTPGLPTTISAVR